MSDHFGKDVMQFLLFPLYVVFEAAILQYFEAANFIDTFKRNRTVFRCGMNEEMTKWHKGFSSSPKCH